jgi:UPF0271 protein
MSILRIDINCDMGESYGRFKVGNDEQVFPYITSCNIACGFHGGDPLSIENTIKNAIRHGVQIGAHPSYPDLSGFGRRKMQLKRADLKACIKYQVAALKGLTESQGGRLAYVKPHGALYNTAADDESETRTIMEAIREIDPKLALMGLAGSITQKIALKEGMTFIAEAFADRKYEANGRLMSRTKAGSVLSSAEEAAAQVVSIALHNQVISADGSRISIYAQSICIHGDNPSAIGMLQAIDEALKQHHILKKSFPV